MDRLMAVSISAHTASHSPLLCTCTPHYPLFFLHFYPLPSLLLLHNSSFLPTPHSLLQHSFKYLTSQRLRSIMRCHEVDSLFQYDLPAVIIPRVPGTPGHDQVKDVSCCVCVCERCVYLFLFTCPGLGICVLTRHFMPSY